MAVFTPQFEFVDLGTVIKCDEYYPRKEPDFKIVDDYADAMRNGAQFPPIILESGTNRILDGVHRFLAAKKAGINKIRVEYRSVPSGMTPKYYAATLNAHTRHGILLSESEMKTVAREYIQSFSDSEMTGIITKISIEFGKPLSTIQSWVSDIYNSKKWNLKTTVFKLNQLGFTQQQISDLVSSGQSTISNYVAELPRLKNQISDQFDRTLDMKAVAKNLDLPILLAWSLYLEDKDDQARMKRLDFTIKSDDVWNFTAEKKDFGNVDYPGRCVPDLIANLLYMFTWEHALVMDPMVGGATTIDVCLAMNRHCIAFDNKVIYTGNFASLKDRVEIEQKDVSNGVSPPEKRLKNKVQMIFFDPPYVDKIDYGAGSVGNLPKAKYLESINRIVGSFDDWLHHKGIVAFLMQDYNPQYFFPKAENKEAVMMEDYVDIFKKHGYHIHVRISSPYPSDLYPASERNRMIKEHRMKNRDRYLIIFAKAKPYDIADRDVVV